MTVRNTKDLYGKGLILKKFWQNENNYRTCEHLCVIVLVSCCFGRNFEVHTRFVFDPSQSTLIPYNGRIALPYKHSKLAEIAKLRPSTSEREDTIGRLRASRYEQGSLISHFAPLFWMNVALSSIPEKLKICSIHREQNNVPRGSSDLTWNRLTAPGSPRMQPCVRVLVIFGYFLLFLIAEVDGYTAKSSMKPIFFYIGIFLLSACWIEMADSKDDVKTIRDAL